MPNKPAIPPTIAYDYLDRAQQLLQHGWVQGREAIDKDGNSCPPHSDLAVAYCEIGAVKAVTHYDPDSDVAYRYIMSLLDAANALVITKGSVPAVNDSTTHEHVIMMFDRAKAYLIRHFGESNVSN